MKNIPITQVINSWNIADAKLSNLCFNEDSAYDSDSAYRGYMVGYDDGVKSQAEEGSAGRVIEKKEVADAFHTFYARKSAVSEEDCVKYISTSEQYWFFAGAMWLMNELSKK